jgi:hypothetical protein
LGIYNMPIKLYSGQIKNYYFKNTKLNFNIIHILTNYLHYSQAKICGIKLAKYPT